ncbi:replication protein [Cytobacillus oceanisediminis]|uniref:replication protein n=1 Tax=Cytobacillus oceanisediminis TaxID=665099 RepID=UPI00203C8E77|nr:replication protein [Cytobacillus oceanisediminis]MCM3241331.1 replication protein [Cytobacillus oceanisediminis]
MAGSRIKGITIQLDGDTRGLEQSLQSVNRRTKDVQSELKDVERLLKFNPNNVELLAQRQELLTDAIQSTTTKLNQLRQAEAQVQAQFERGEISQEQYRGFRRELQQTEQQLASFEQSLQDIATEQEQVGQRTRQMTALFEATGTSVEDYANVIGQRLVRAIQNGTATSRDLEYAFQRIGRQAIGANGDIERLRNTLATVDSGNSIQNIRRDLQQLQAEAQDTEEAVEGIGDSLSTLVGAAAAGGGIAGSVQQALDAASLETRINILFDVPEESKQSIKEAVMGIQAYGVDGEEALEGVRRQWALNKDASDAVNDTIARGAAAIARNFAGVDYIELIQETNEVAAALKISNEEALALTDSLLKAGFPPEQLDTISEYGTQMQLAGYNAAEIQAIFEAGINTKTWNIDNLNDGVKEARLQMATFGLEIPKALQPLLKEAGMSEKKFQEWGKAVAAGGKEGSEAMSAVAEWLDTIDNKELKNELATKVFGTKWEDQGDNMIAVFNGVADAADKTTENVNGLYKTMGETNADPMVELQQAINNVKLALAPVLTEVLKVVTAITQWVAENPKLAATITTIVTALGILIGIFMALAPIVTAIVTLAAGLGVSIGALALPITLIVAGITALIAIGVALYQNWDEIRTKGTEIFTNLLNFLKNTWDFITNLIGQALDWIDQQTNGKFTSITNTVRNFMSTASNILERGWQFIKDTFSNALKFAKALLSGDFEAMWQVVEDQMGNIKDTVSDIWGEVESFFEGIDLSDIGADIIRGLISGMGSLAKEITRKVSYLASLIPDGMKDFLGIASPSRLMRDEIGKWIPLGVAEGISRNAGAIDRASEQMMANAIPTLPKMPAMGIGAAGSSTGSAGGNNTFNFAGMMQGATFIVRNDYDIELIARELGNHVIMQARKGGVVFGG